jgi:hypothetical protein
MKKLLINSSFTALTLMSTNIFADVVNTNILSTDSTAEVTWEEVVIKNDTVNKEPNDLTHISASPLHETKNNEPSTPLVRIKKNADNIETEYTETEANPINDIVQPDVNEHTEVSWTVTTISTATKKIETIDHKQTQPQTIDAEEGHTPPSSIIITEDIKELPPLPLSETFVNSDNITKDTKTEKSEPKTTTHEPYQSNAEVSWTVETSTTIEKLTTSNMPTVIVPEKKIDLKPQVEKHIEEPTRKVQKSPDDLITKALQNGSEAAFTEQFEKLVVKTESQEQESDALPMTHEQKRRTEVYHACPSLYNVQLETFQLSEHFSPPESLDLSLLELLPSNSYDGPNNESPATRTENAINNSKKYKKIISDSKSISQNDTSIIFVKSYGGFVQTAENVSKNIKKAVDSGKQVTILTSFSHSAAVLASSVVGAVRVQIANLSSLFHEARYIDEGDTASSNDDVYTFQNDLSSKNTRHKSLSETNKRVQEYLVKNSLNLIDIGCAEAIIKPKEKKGPANDIYLWPEEQLQLGLREIVYDPKNNVAKVRKGELTQSEVENVLRFGNKEQEAPIQVATAKLPSLALR